MNELQRKWLVDFGEACKTRKPTDVYDYLVQMGVEQFSTCDCLSAIQEQEKKIEEAEQDLKDVNWSDQFISLTKRKIERAKKDIEYHKEMHAGHSEYNREVHRILSQYGMRRIRRACLSDLRGPTSMLGTDEYCRIARKEYGELISTFLVAKPKGWF
jgi:hypothetical protein